MLKLKIIFRELELSNLVGLGITTLISLLLLVLGTNTIDSFTLGLVLGLFTELLVVQAKISRIERKTIALRALNIDLDRNEFLLDMLESIISSYKKIKKLSSDPFEFKSVSERSIRECEYQLKEMAKGFNSVEGESPFLASTQALREARYCIKAVDTEDLEIWSHADNYLKEHQIKLDDKVNIKRVFVYEDQEIYDHNKILERQYEMGIEVFTFSQKHLVKKIEDFIIIDDNFLVVSEVDKQGKRERRRIINKTEVDRYINEFNKIHMYSKTYKFQKYFAYGSNLNKKHFLKRCPLARVSEKAILIGYRLSFPQYDQFWKGGSAGVVPDENFNVEGVIYEIPNSDLLELDKIEEVDKGEYQRKKIRVKNLSGQSIEVWVYIPRGTGEEFHLPTPHYRDLIIEGAVDHKLSQDYIEYLRQCK